jgi:hypothetical protein
MKSKRVRIKKDLSGFRTSETRGVLGARGWGIGGVNQLKSEELNVFETGCYAERWCGKLGVEI